jgi:hypothetical protein
MSDDNLVFFLNDSFKKLFEIEQNKLFKLQNLKIKNKKIESKEIINSQNLLNQYINVVHMYNSFSNDKSLNWILIECNKLKMLYTNIT